MIIGLTSGCFDLFHHGHLQYLETCKSHCDKLLVGVDSNELVQKTKGAGRPIHGEMHRFNLVNSLIPVDMAFILHDIEGLTYIAEDFHVSKVFKCEKFRNIKVYGAEKAELVVIPDIPGMISTTKIIEWIKAGNISPIPVRE